ncbi:MAG: hypothetical protein AMXMBFR84_38380 [Candidatus Hydrogenedentota bacterium]
MGWSRSLAVAVALALLSTSGCSKSLEPSGSNRIPVQFSGGYETEPVDKGRPVKLIASALGVASEVFRDAFSRVNPAPAFSVPGPERVHDNKAVLMQALGPYGITNDRLDEVSNFYRYNRSLGQMWRHEDAEAYAIVQDGALDHIEMANPGYGYNTTPTATVPGYETTALIVEMAYGPDFDTNGSVASIKVQFSAP